MTSLRTPTVVMVVLAVAVAACAGAPTDDTAAEPPVVAAPTPPSAATPDVTPPPEPPDDGPGRAAADAPAQDAVPDLAAVALRTEPVVDLDAPTAMTVRAGDDALYVAERGGRIVRVVDGEVAGDAVLDISSETTVDGERGLLGLAFSPDGAQLYVSFTGPDGDSRLDAYAMADGAADPSSRRRLLEVAQPFSNHNGGHVVTGPDGLLYWGLGDGGSAGDPQGNGQDPSTLLGSLLRIDPTAGDGAYAVPDDNPFVDGDAGRPEVWVYGLRNPWRFSFDRATDDLWIGDVGQGALEEIDRLPLDGAAGANLGWNVFEGTARFGAGDAPDAVPPVHTYPHDGGRCSVTGGYVYRGDAIDGLRGAYVFGDFCDGVVRALAVDGDGTADVRTFDVQVPAWVSVGEDAAGELYVLSLDGAVERLVPAG